MNTDLVMSPSEFVDVFNQTIDYAYPRIIIEGEISSFKVAKNRWLYFDIKDDTATIRCFGTVYMLPGPLENGMMVQIVCTPRLHPQFNFSLQIQSIVPTGAGAIARAAELLYKKLESEGIFAPERKRSLPYAPERIALVTSAESAAYADFVKITRTRWPLLRIDVYSTLVQGLEAPTQIVSAIESANQSGTAYEALVLIRGGGSAEDLSAFSDERVVRSIAASRVPTLVAIGHEIDESLAELTADARASTPSNAAELLTPDVAEEWLTLESRRSYLASVLTRVSYEAQQFVREYRSQLTAVIKHAVTIERLRLGAIHDRLVLLDPREVLKRGYALVSKSGVVVANITKLSVGDEVAILMKDGETKARII
jgi:exodeoxyribonuclease VII large subunit